MTDEEEEEEDGRVEDHVTGAPSKNPLISWPNVCVYFVLSENT